MEIIKHDQAIPIQYFDLLEFVKKIKISDKVLTHLKFTEENFKEYFSKLSNYNDEFILQFLIALAYDEIKNSNKIEKITYDEFDFDVKDLFFDKFQMSHNRMHKIHKFVMKDELPNKKVGSYRKTPVRVSNIEKNHEEIFWYGAEVQDIKKFMNNFIKIYKSTSNECIDSNPYLKSALMHLIFVKIHPYFDGNGRTARILHNIKFTELINKKHDMDLRICPVNLSESIDLNKITYINTLDSIYFDLDHDNNDIINKWFDFMLNMYDEQLYVNENLITNMDDIVVKIDRIKQNMKKFDQRILKKNKIKR